MRYLFILIFVFALTAPTSATDFGNAPKDTKTNTHIGQNPGTPDEREGGEDMDNPVVINALPFDDTGNTSDNIDNYDVACPVGSSQSPDVVYSYTPTMNECIRVDLCGSGYDTKTYIFDGSYNVIACNDDYYYNDDCGEYVSLIEEAQLVAGSEYFIIIDGYGGDSGDYILNIRISDPAPPWPLMCEGLNEGEPPLGYNYADAFNGGCNSPQFGNPIADLTQAGDENGNLIFCGQSGWYNQSNGSTWRDTDWMYFMIGQSGMIEWTLEAEYQVNGLLLSGDCDAGINIADLITFTPSIPAFMMIIGNPGDVVMLWVGPSDYSPPSGFVGYEFSYKCIFTGLNADGPVPTSNLSFDAMKSLYR
jgi:hypothetical protein